MIAMTSLLWLLQTVSQHLIILLKNKVTEKGAILTQMSKFWFDYTKDVVSNHMDFS